MRGSGKPVFMKKRRGQNARLAALSLLEAVLDKGQNLAEAESGARLTDPRDRAFARYLAYGVLRWLNALDWLARQLLKRPLKQRDRDIHRLILLGLYQLWKDGSAPHAAINEAAESARIAGKPWAVGLINAVLRKFQREQDRWLARLATHDERFAHPEWLLTSLKEDWPCDWENIVEANNCAAPLWLRLNRNVPAAETLERLQQDGFALQRHEAATDAVKVEPAAPVQELAGFSSGRFSVQDPAAQLAALLLEARSNHRVLDACAAPGGKTGHLLELAPDMDLYVLDRSQQRLQMVRDNLQRLGYQEGPRIRLQQADASLPDAWWDGILFDRILLDAPCSASGVIRRHPEIKWLRTDQQVHEAAALQATLLDRLWPLLKPGGMLLYATCSVLRNENGRQITRFLERTEDAVQSDFDATWGRQDGPGRQLLPGELEMDGFFYARLCKQP